MYILYKQMEGISSSQELYGFLLVLQLVLTSNMILVNQNLFIWISDTAIAHLEYWNELEISAP